AASQFGRTGKNPAVGCVIIGADGTKLSEGATGDGGSDHAEALALSALVEGSAKGGTAYVTLEPCRKRSAGGSSCSELLLHAGIVRLVCAISDPHPNGAGGFDRLREAGIAVEIGLMETEAAALYQNFFVDVSAG
ncbi:MAG: riboflavin biosynthesis protein RibD, partial [Pseudomonadota bacterium]